MWAAGRVESGEEMLFDHISMISNPLVFGHERAIAVGSWQYVVSF